MQVVMDDDGRLALRLKIAQHIDDGSFGRGIYGCKWFIHQE